MPAIIETGHAKNVANFQDLISFCIAYGATYNPSKTNIKIPALQTLHTNASNSMYEVLAKSTAFNNAVNERMLAFKTIKPLSTRLLNAIQATDASDEVIKDVKTINRKIQGKRAKETQTPAIPADPNTPPQKNISASQQSYDLLIQHFYTLIQILKTEPNYSPNEQELKITTLQTYLAKLTNTNTAVINTYTDASNARISRNKILYLPSTGLYDITQDIKKYIQSIFGFNSPQYKQIRIIKFTKRKF